MSFCDAGPKAPTRETTLFSDDNVPWRVTLQSVDGCPSESHSVSLGLNKRNMIDAADAHVGCGEIH